MAHSRLPSRRILCLLGPQSPNGGRLKVLFVEITAAMVALRCLRGRKAHGAPTFGEQLSRPVPHTFVVRGHAGTVSPLVRTRAAYSFTFREATPVDRTQTQRGVTQGSSCCCTGGELLGRQAPRRAAASVHARRIEPRGFWREIGPLLTIIGR